MVFGFHSFDMLPNLISDSMTFQSCKKLKIAKLWAILSQSERLLSFPILSEAVDRPYKGKALTPVQDQTLVSQSSHLFSVLPSFTLPTKVFPKC